MMTQKRCKFCRVQFSAYTKCMRFCCKSHAAQWQHEQHINRKPWLAITFQPELRPVFDWKAFRVAV